MRRIKRGNLEPAQKSIVINLMPVIQSRGIKFPNAYLKRLGISSNSAIKLLKGEASQINMNQITAICVALNCTPNDLFAVRDMELPPRHALNALEKLKPVSDMMTVEEFLRGKSIEEVRGLLKRGNR